MGNVKPQRGHIVVVPQLPKCDFCIAPATYDFKTRMGPWANGCEAHWHQHAQYWTTGVGMGQRLITDEEVTA